MYVNVENPTASALEANFDRRLGLVTGEVTYGVDRQTYEFRFDLPVTLVAMIDAGGGEE